METDLFYFAEWIGDKKNHENIAEIFHSKVFAHIFHPITSIWTKKTEVLCRDKKKIFMRCTLSVLLAFFQIFLFMNKCMIDASMYERKHTEKATTLINGDDDHDDDNSNNE